MIVRSPIHLRDVEVLGQGRYALRRYAFDYHRRDGRWQTLERETCLREESVVALPFSRRRRTIVLTRQFRLPVLLQGGGDGRLIEAPSGLIDGETAVDAIRREVEEETGYRPRRIQKVFVAFMSPTLAAERVHFFVADVDGSDLPNGGGGCAKEGEDIEVFETSLDTAVAMIAFGDIVDAKTILLLHYAKMTRLL
jgi:nudix-type nucleoside diphosphatase (YffH/AdpP family)